MTVYTPSSLILTDGEPERRLYSKKIQSDQIHQYDSKTLLFDAVRVDGRNDIGLFGPPLLNFRKNPGLPRIECAGERLRYRVKSTAMGRFTEWSLEKRKTNVSDSSILDFRFKDIPDRRIRINRVKPFPAGSKVLTAIQKNNEIRWIKDWFRHYKERFGVDYLVLYDNGSDDFDVLSAELPENTILVDWRFPYGPTFSHDNKFAQLGALNHCRCVFAPFSYIFNFDIDELLVLKKYGIDEMLEKRRVVYFSSFNVPNQKDLTQDFSFNSYSQREAVPRYYARKFVYHAPSSTGILPHYVQTQRFRPFAYLILLLRKARNTMIVKEGHKNFKVRLLSALIRLTTSNSREPSLSVETAYFLHFLGISTHWKDLNYRRTYCPECIDDPFLLELKGEST